MAPVCQKIVLRTGLLQAATRWKVIGTRLAFFYNTQESEIGGIMSTRVLQSLFLVGGILLSSLCLGADEAKIGIPVSYRGELVRGYWQDPGQVRWRPARTADLDTRVICGPAAQVWYGTSWIFAPAETRVKFQFQGHPQTYFRWFLNGEKVLAGQIGKTGEPEALEKTLTLRQGWNQVFFRGYCVGYPPFRAGLVLAGPPETLWKLRLSTVPPDSARTVNPTALR